MFAALRRAVAPAAPVDSWEGRIELLQNALGPLSGSIGFQALSRDFEAIGEEAFVPPTQTDSWAVFAFEELERGAIGSTR